MTIELTIPDELEWGRIWPWLLWGYVGLCYMVTPFIIRANAAFWYPEGKAISISQVNCYVTAWIFSPLIGWAVASVFIVMYLFCRPAKWIVIGNRKIDWTAETASRPDREDFRM